MTPLHRPLAFIRLALECAAWSARSIKPVVVAHARDRTLRLVLAPPEAPVLAYVGSGTLRTALRGLRAGDFERLEIRVLGRDGRLGPPLLLSVGSWPDEKRIARLRRAAARVARRRPDPEASAARGADFYGLFDMLAREPELIDAAAVAVERRRRNPAVAAPVNAPFDRPEHLPKPHPQPKRRSVLFLHNSYYHFNCLADGLRKRGWDALTVSLESPDSPQRQFYHGEDLNLFHPDQEVMRDRTRRFFATVPERFGALHFYGQGQPSFFLDNFENNEAPERIPWDFLELRRHRTIIGYMPSGCLDGAPKSSIRQISGGVCDRCVWQTRADVCNEARSRAWAHKLSRLCDWIGLEGDWAVPERVGPRTVYGPVVTALDPDRWKPGLEPPEELRIEKSAGTLAVYHAVGNYRERRSGGRDIKGTGAVMDAVDRLAAEGWPVRLIFAQDIPSRQVRFLQIQADVVVDQLNYGRYGANARECLMLGLPVITKARPNQAPPLPPLRAVAEAPFVDADEASVYAALKSLLADPARRARLGAAGRAFALAWHGQDACAARYEAVIDRLRAGRTPDSPDLYPAPATMQALAGGAAAA